jgi:hypothetical protein
LVIEGVVVFVTKHLFRQWDVRRFILVLALGIVCAALSALLVPMYFTFEVIAFGIAYAIFSAPSPLVPTGMHFAFKAFVFEITCVVLAALLVLMNLIRVLKTFI